MQELNTLRDYVRWTLSQLGQHPVVLGHGTDTLWDEALALVFGALHLPPDGDVRLLDAKLTADEGTRLKRLIDRRILERVPVPYLVGRAWYAGLPFIVDERVLIPRSPIFELLQVECQPWLAVPSDRPLKILDLCTGSGCLGILAGLTFPESTGVLVDIDAGALEVAAANLRLHGLESRFELVQSDGLMDLSDETFDLVLCNPPYVDAEDMADLPEEYRHEPTHALASGEDGLTLTRQILSSMTDWIAPDGLMVLEVGNSWGRLDAWVTPKTGHAMQWLSFAGGGHGVCILSKNELDALYLRF